MFEHKNASDLFVKALESEGVEVIYGVPGEENLVLLESIRKSNIKFIVTRHEQAAAFMAATYGRLTGKAGVALSTLGPGATNFTTAAAYATLGGFPLIIITGQKPIEQSKQGLFQIIDIDAMMKPITKLSKRILDVNLVSSTVRESFKVAQEEKPGAVHIEFPEDITEQTVTEKTKSVIEPIITTYSEPNLNIISKVANMISNAKMPLILFAAGCNRVNTTTENANSLSEALTNFINTTSLPFICTQMGKGSVSECNPNYVGTTSLSALDYVHDLIQASDLIINIGHDPIEKPPYFMSNKNLQVVHISNTSAIVDNVYFPTIEVIGNIASSVAMLAKEVGSCNKDFISATKTKDFLLKEINSYKYNNSFPIKPQRLVTDVKEVLGDDGYLSLDNGMYKLWFARNYIAEQANSILLDNALATMGAGLPCGMEIARLYPNKKVVVVTGDGGFMMNSQELETATRLKLNLVVVVLNDSGYGMIKWKQGDMHFKDYSLDFTNPDFVKYAESFGIEGHKVLKTENFKELLKSCLNKKGLHLIDLTIDYSENKKLSADYLKNKNKII